MEERRGVEEERGWRADEGGEDMKKVRRGDKCREDKEKKGEEKREYYKREERRAEEETTGEQKSKEEMRCS